MRKFVLAAILLLLIVGSCVAEEAFFSDLAIEEMTGRYADATSAFVNVDGMQVHYRDTGAGDQPPLLLLHGNSSSLHAWDGWARAFEGSRRVVRLDLPGFGLTGPDPEKRYGFKALKGFLGRFADQVGLPVFDLAGNSHGGRLAWAYAAEYPDRVRKLILVDAAGYPLNFKSMTLATIRGTWPISFFANYLTPRFAVRYAISSTFGDQTKVTEEMVDHYLGLQLRTGNRAALGEMTSIYGVDDRADIKSIKAPTLILWGKLDQVIPVEDAERFHKDIAGSEVIVYDGVGHMPMEEIPERSAADAEAFLKR